MLILLNVYRLLRFKIALHELSEGDILVHKIDGVVIVEQNAKQTLKIADYGYVLELGKINQQGPAAELLASSSLIEAYLGK